MDENIFCLDKKNGMRLKFTPTILIAFILFTLQVNAQLSNSLDFNGRDNYVEIPGRPLNQIGTGDFTFEAWIKGDENEQPEHPTIFSNRGTDAFDGGLLFFIHGKWGGSKTKMLCVQLNAINLIIINNGTFDGSLLDNNCHHVAVTKRGNLISFYADGVLFGTETYNSPVSISTDNPLWIGQDKATNNTFDGTISQCRIWNVARTEREIFDNQFVSIEGNEPGLIAYWEMNDGEGELLRDKVDQYDGVLGPNSQKPNWSEDSCMEEGSPPLTLLSICPNPTFDILRIKNPNENTVSLRLFDALGRLVLIDEINGASHELDLHSYAGGVYFLQFLNQGERIVKKIVKQ